MRALQSSRRDYAPSTVALVCVVACAGVTTPRDGDRAKIINFKGRKAALLYLQLIGEEYDWLASGHIEVRGMVIGCELYDYGRIRGIFQPRP